MSSMDSSLVAEGLVREVMRQRQPVLSRYVQTLRLSEEADVGLRALRVMPHGNEWRWLDAKNRWWVCPTEQIEILGRRLLAGRRAGGMAEMLERLALASWDLDAPAKCRPWDWAEKSTRGFLLSPRGDVLLGDELHPYQLEDVEDRSKVAAALGQYAVWEMCERALDGCMEAFEAFVEISLAENSAFAGAYPE